MTDCPIVSVNFWATILAATSVPPPAEKPTKILIDLSGYRVVWLSAAAKQMTRARPSNKPGKMRDDLNKVLPRSQGLAFRLVVERDCVQLEPMVDLPITEAPRDVRLQAFDVFRLKLDHLARAQINEMIVMAVGHLLVARAPVTEVMS